MSILVNEFYERLELGSQEKAEEITFQNETEVKTQLYRAFKSA